MQIVICFFTDDVKIRYAQFTGMMNFNQGNPDIARNQLRTRFGNTWWYYYLMVNIDQISKGNWE